MKTLIAIVTMMVLVAGNNGYGQGQTTSKKSTGSTQTSGRTTTVQQNRQGNTGGNSGTHSSSSSNTNTSRSTTIVKQTQSQGGNTSSSHQTTNSNSNTGGNSGNQSSTRQTQSNVTHNNNNGTQNNNRGEIHQNNNSNVRQSNSGNVSTYHRNNYNNPQSRDNGHQSQTGRSVNYERVNKYPSSRHYHSDRPVYHHYEVAPRPREYRSIYSPYRMPVYVDIVWSPSLYREYCYWYPGIHWNYKYGYRIPTISAYDAIYDVGEVRRVYGFVNEVYYAYETDEYILYIGAYYPYQDLSIVVEGNEARKFSFRPEIFFQGQYVAVTGLITAYSDCPEIVVYNRTQLDIY